MRLTHYKGELCELRDGNYYSCTTGKKVGEVEKVNKFYAIAIGKGGKIK